MYRSSSSSSCAMLYLVLCVYICTCRAFPCPTIFSLYLSTYPSQEELYRSFVACSLASWLTPTYYYHPPPRHHSQSSSCQAAVSHSTKVLKFWLDGWLAGWPWRWCQVLLSFVILRAHSLWVLLLLLFSEDFCGKRDYIIIQPVTQQQQARTGQDS